MGKQQDLPRMFPFAARLPPLAAPSVYVQVLGLPAPVGPRQAPPELTLKCRFTSSVAAENDGVMYPCQPFRRGCKIPYKMAAAAAETLSESTRPRIGSEINWSQWSATRGRSPLPSDPITRTTRPW